MDCIRIRQLEVWAYHGCEKEEREKGQQFYIDVELFCDTRQAATSDELEDAVNYAKVCRFIKKCMTDRTYNLMETAAEYTVNSLLKEFPKIREVEFTIIKKSAPENVDFGDVSISIRRRWNRAYLSMGINPETYSLLLMPADSNNDILTGVEIDVQQQVDYLNQIVDNLYDDDNCRVVSLSNYVQTPFNSPAGVTHLIYGCVEIETLYSPKQLQDFKDNLLELNKIRNIEEIDSSNIVDIDIILYENKIIRDGDIMIPDSEMHKKEYVLEPLNQIAPYVMHPIFYKTVSQMLEELKPQSQCGSCGGCSKCDGCSK